MYAVDPRFQPVKWRGTAREGSEAQGDVASITVRAFAQLLGVDLSRARAAPRRDYQRREADMSVVRRTIRWGALASRTSPIPVPCRFWERDLDMPLNRLFAAATYGPERVERVRHTAEGRGGSRHGCEGGGKGRGPIGGFPAGFRRAIQDVSRWGRKFVFSIAFPLPR